MTIRQNFGDFYPTFGVMKGRSFASDTNEWYRFGFGGQEIKLELSKSSNTEHISLMHPGLKFGPRSGFTRTTFLKNEHSELLKFSTFILGHEAQLSGTDIKGLPATRSIVPYATDERGELYELHFYGDVKGHHDFGFSVYNAFETRKYLPGQQNREEEFKTNIEAFWNSKYGK